MAEQPRGMPIPAHQRKDFVAYAYQRRNSLFKLYGQYFYTIGAIKDMLNANAIQSSDEFVQGAYGKRQKLYRKRQETKGG